VEFGEGCMRRPISVVMGPWNLVVTPGVRGAAHVSPGAQLAPYLLLAAGVAGDKRLRFSSQNRQ
jgi:hypothetical protein